MPKYNCCFPRKMKSNITEGCSTFSFEQLDEFIKIDKNCGIIHTEIEVKSNSFKKRARRYREGHRRAFL